MKALQSELAKALLADPEARDKLRTFIVTRSAPVLHRPVKGEVAGKQEQQEPFVIEVETPDGRTRRVTPVVLPKAAS